MMPISSWAKTYMYADSAIRLFTRYEWQQLQLILDEGIHVFFAEESLEAVYRILHICHHLIFGSYAKYAILVAECYVCSITFREYSITHGSLSFSLRR
jgi:hypothetical protein